MRVMVVLIMFLPAVKMPCHQQLILHPHPLAHKHMHALVIVRVVIVLMIVVVVFLPHSRAQVTAESFPCRQQKLVMIQQKKKVQHILLMMMAMSGRLGD